MAYTVMLWLVNPGEQAHEQEALEHTQGSARAEHPGAVTGVNVPPTLTRLVYGHYALEDEAHKVLEEIERALSQNRALHVHHSNGHHFVIPTARVHYAVMAEAPQTKT